MGVATAVLSPYYKRAAQTLYSNVMRISKESKGIGYLAFITLTFKNNVRDHLEASRCWKSANSHWFAPNPDFGTYINTRELQEKRRMVWHYHIIAEVQEDIREGFDFPAFREWLKGNNRFKGPCPTGSPYFLRLWKELNEAVPHYGFGIINSIEPIETNEEMISRYIGGYIGKTIGRRSEQQKGVRLVNYPKGWVRNSPKFSWNTANAAEWRRKVAKFASVHGCTDFYQLSQLLGRNWAYKYLKDILNVDENHLESRIDDWRIEEDGSRISRHTGEIQTEEQRAYQDTIFKAIQNNQQQKDARLKADAAGTLLWGATQKQIERKLRQKEENRHEIEMAKDLIRSTVLEPGPPLTPLEKENLHLNSMLRKEHREAELHLSDDYLESVGVERKMKTLEPVPFKSTKTNK